MAAAKSFSSPPPSSAAILDGRSCTNFDLKEAGSTHVEKKYLPHPPHKASMPERV